MNSRGASNSLIAGTTVSCHFTMSYDGFPCRRHHRGKCNTVICLRSLDCVMFHDDDLTTPYERLMAAKCNLALCNLPILTSFLDPHLRRWEERDCRVVCGTVCTMIAFCLILSIKWKTPDNGKLFPLEISGPSAFWSLSVVLGSRKWRIV